MSAVDRVCVIVPARNEERLLPGCLDSIGAAVTLLARAFPRLRPQVTVVLDSCQDRTADVVRARPGVRVVRVEAANVGSARASGIEAALSTGDGAAAGTVWIASTDADTRVPPRWLARQVGYAQAGHDLVLGTVQLPEHTVPAKLDAWASGYHHREGHPHVHGANLGVRASAYRAVGGYRPLAEHEDADLVARLKRAGVRWVATDSIRVTTSARANGRTPGGFAAALRRSGAADADRADEPGAATVQVSS